MWIFSVALFIIVLKHQHFYMQFMRYQDSRAYLMKMRTVKMHQTFFQPNLNPLSIPSTIIYIQLNVSSPQKLENILHNLFILHRSPFTVHYYLQEWWTFANDSECAMFINYFSSYFLNVDAIFHIVCGRIFVHSYSWEQRTKVNVLKYYELEFNSIKTFVSKSNVMVVNCWWN